MDLVAYAARTTGPITSGGGAFMLHPDTTARGEAIGLDFAGFYGLGRGGVLGDVDADVVISAMAFFEPGIVRTLWDAARQKMTPAEGATKYAEACAAWGRDHLSGVDGLDELATLLGKVVDAASPIGAPLFAGWRAMPLPDDAPGRATQLLHVMRELRGGLHIVALLASGVSPLDALLCDTPDEAALFGWSEPLPDPEPSRDAFTRANELTNQIVAPVFAVLDDAERERLAAILDDMLAAVSS